MHRVDRIYPIILPKQQYIDRFREPNALVDMNPSMHISIDGVVTLLVRRVNYRKYADRKFSLGIFPSYSKYVVAKGHIDNLMQWEWKPPHVDYGIPTYLSL